MSQCTGYSNALPNSSHASFSNFIAATLSRGGTSSPDEGHRGFFGASGAKLLPTATPPPPTTPSAVEVARLAN